MKALAALGLRLSRAGGCFRSWCVAIGNAIATMLLLVALNLPVAIYADPTMRSTHLASTRMMFALAVIPAAVLLLTVGRLSSGIRDRRLASLRMIGVTPWRTRFVAAIENGIFALAGAVVGALLYAILAAPISRAIMAGPGWFEQTLPINPAAIIGVTVLITALSMVLGTSATWERGAITEQRSESQRRAPRPWRFAVFVLGLALMWATNLFDHNGMVSPTVYVVGAIVTAISIALVTPLVSGWIGRWLATSSIPWVRLAGRAIETDAVSGARVVSGLGAALFLCTGLLGLTAFFVNDGSYRQELQAITGTGPQTITLRRPESPTTDANQIYYGATTPVSIDWNVAKQQSIMDVPGVRGVLVTDVGAVPNQSLRSGQLVSDPMDWRNWPVPVVVGNCADLAQLIVATGCDDTQASLILRGDQFDSIEPVNNSLVFHTAGGTYVEGSADGPTWAENPEQRFEVPLSTEPIAIDLDATLADWPQSRFEEAFIPISLVPELAANPPAIMVVADGGLDVQQRVADWAQANGLVAEMPGTQVLDSVNSMRAVMGVFAAIALGVGLISMALTAADRALERRRSVARQVMVGVPAQVLQTSQAAQVLVPLAATIVVAVGSAFLLLRSLYIVQGARPEVATTLLRNNSWGMLALIIGVGALLAVLSTVPLIRTRLTPDLLRRE